MIRIQSSMLTAAATAAVVLAACSNGGDRTSSPQEASPSATAGSTAHTPINAAPSAVPTATERLSSSPGRCQDVAGGGDTVLLDVSVDMEGDGKRDRLLSNGVGGTFTVRFSRGGSAKLHVSKTPSAFLQVEADGLPTEDEILAVYRGPIGQAKTDARNAVLVDLEGCSLRVAVNRSGSRYVFEVGRESDTGIRHGITCRTHEGTDLVGTTAEPIDGGARFKVTSTPVAVRDGRATNGPATTTTMARDAPEAADLDKATCHGRSPIEAPMGAG